MVSKTIKSKQGGKTERSARPHQKSFYYDLPSDFDGVPQGRKQLTSGVDDLIQKVKKARSYFNRDVSKEEHLLKAIFGEKILSEKDIINLSKEKKISIGFVSFFSGDEFGVAKLCLDTEVKYRDALDLAILIDYIAHKDYMLLSVCEYYYISRYGKVIKDINSIKKVVRSTALNELNEDIELDSRPDRGGRTSEATGHANIVGHIPSQLKAKFEKALEQRDLDADVVLTELIKNYLNDIDPPGPSIEEVKVPSGDDQTVSAQTKPRSYERYRTTEEIPMRLGEQLVRQIDAAAKVSGVNRNQWLVQTIQSQIASAGADVHKAYPDYDQKRRIKVRLSSDLSSQVGEAANALGISKTEWIRRLASSQLNSTSPYPAPTI